MHLPATERRATQLQCIIDLPPEESPPAPAIVHGIRDPASPTKRIRFCDHNRTAKCSDNPDYEGTIRGIRYQQFADGSGWVDGEISSDNKYPSQWKIECTRDVIARKQDCLAYRGDLWIFASRAGVVRISVGAEHYPRSLTQIRINDQRFSTEHADGNFHQSSQIIPLLKDGSTLATRYMRWPYRSWIDSESQLYGVEATVELLRWTAKTLK